MAHFIVKVANYEFGSNEGEYRLNASNEGTAAARAFREFKKEKLVPRRHYKDFIIKIHKV